MAKCSICGDTINDDQVKTCKVCDRTTCGGRHCGTETRADITGDVFWICQVCVSDFSASVIESPSPENE